MNQDSKKYVVEYTVGVAAKLIRSTPMSRTAAKQYMRKVKAWPDTMSARIEAVTSATTVVKWMVEYKVMGQGPGVFTRGPYSDSDVGYHVADIAEYEGVYGVVKVPARGGSVTKEQSNG